MSGSRARVGLSRFWRVTAVVAAVFLGYGVARAFGWPQTVATGHPPLIRSIADLASAAVAVWVALCASESITERGIWWSGAALLALPLWGWAPVWRSPGTVTAATVALDFMMGGFLASEAVNGYASSMRDTKSKRPR